MDTATAASAAPATTPAFTHAAAFNVREGDRAALVAFIQRANHCPCDALRCGGVLVHQTGGFDGPHLVPSYCVIRESDGAEVAALSLWRDGRAEVLADVALGCARPEVLPLNATRIRLDPHPAGYCPACL